MSETFRTGSYAEGRVTLLTNKILQDQTLSFRARGIASSAISYPRDYEWSAEKLANLSPNEGRDAIRTALNELEASGYLRRTKHQNSKGHWTTTWHLSDDVLPGHAEDGFPGVGPNTEAKPKTDFQASVPPAQTPVSAGHTEDGSAEVGFSGDKNLKEYNQTNKTKKNKNTDRTNGSVGARETSDSGEDQIEVQEPKSAPTREQELAEVTVSSSVAAGSGVEDQELKPWQMRDYWGNIVKNPEYVPTEADVAWLTNYYITEAGYDPDYAASFSRSQLMTPAQREAQQFLDSIDVELSVDEKREFYPLVTKLFGGSWQAGDLAQKLCWGLDGFGSPVAGFRKRLKGLAGGLKAA